MFEVPGRMREQLDYISRKLTRGRMDRRSRWHDSPRLCGLKQEGLAANNGVLLVGCSRYAQNMDFVKLRP